MGLALHGSCFRTPTTSKITKKRGITPGHSPDPARPDRVHGRKDKGETVLCPHSNCPRWITSSLSFLLLYFSPLAMSSFIPHGRLSASAREHRWPDQGRRSALPTLAGVYGPVQLLYRVKAILLSEELTSAKPSQAVFFAGSRFSLLSFVCHGGLLPANMKSSVRWRFQGMKQSPAPVCHLTLLCLPFISATAGRLVTMAFFVDLWLGIG